MDSLRLEVRRRSLLLDVRPFVFITEAGIEVEKTDTEGVVRHVERYVNRRLRGAARAHGRAQLLQSLRQFNSPKEGYTQFVVVEQAWAENRFTAEGRVMHERAHEGAGETRVGLRRVLAPRSVPAQGPAVQNGRWRMVRNQSEI